MTLIKKIIKGVKKTILYSAFALKRTEEKQTTQLGNVEGGVIRKNESNSILNDWMNGHETQRTKAYKEHFYKVLDKADEVSSRMKMNEDGSIGFVSKEERDQKYVLSLDKVLDKSDSYKVEYTTQFKSNVINSLEIATINAEPIFDNNVKFFSGDDEVLLRDGILQTIHVKIIDDKKRMLDLFFNFGEEDLYMIDMIKNRPQTILYFDSLIINSGKYREVLNNYKVLSYFGQINPSKGKIIYKIIAEIL